MTIYIIITCMDTRFKYELDLKMDYSQVRGCSMFDEYYHCRFPPQGPTMVS